jgi:hypothetical protein
MVHLEVEEPLEVIQELIQQVQVQVELVIHLL